MESWFWGISKGDPDVLRNCFAPGEALEKWDKMIASKTAEQLKKEAETSSKSVMGYEITEKQMISDKEVVFAVAMVDRNGKTIKPQKLRLQKFENLWKVVGPATQ